MASVDVAEYAAVRDRVVAVVRGIDSATVVPACPAWRVKDVVGHLTGLCEDWVDHRLDGYASDEWTAAQVRRFAASTLDEVLDRWYRASEHFARLGDDPVMGPPARWAFGDAITHEADIRGAVGAERVPHEAVVVALKGSVARWREVLARARTPALLLRASDAREWWLRSADDSDVTVVEAPAYDFFRALTGRRSTAQMEKWQWSGDPRPYFAAGLPYPFHSADVDMED
jgi:uncharacterized protein (TIGR03083 family)